MQYTGQYTLSHPKDQVWRAITDPEILKQAIPKCEDAFRLDDTNFRAVFSFRLGILPLRLESHISLSEVQAPDSYVMTAKGTGKLADMAAGRARVTLAETDQGLTELSFQASGALDGPLAQLAAKLVTKTADRLANDFFSRLDNVMTELKDVQNIS